MTPPADPPGRALFLPVAGKYGLPGFDACADHMIIVEGPQVASQTFILKFK